VPFYLLFMGAAVALAGVIAVLAHSWSIGVWTVAALVCACLVAYQTGKRLSASPD